MAQKTLTTTATISITASGTTRKSGTLSWTAPDFPEGITAWDEVYVLCDLYTWGGKGNFTLTINGTNATSGNGFNIKLPVNVISPYTITGVGSNRNATGSNCRFTNLKLCYVYTEPEIPIIPDVESYTLSVKNNLIWFNTVSVFKKINGAWVEQSDLQSVLDSSKKFVKKQ